MKICHFLLVLLLASITASQVIGIDLGTEFWKASLISPGKNLVIVENTRSSRKSHNGIAFVDGIRHFEYDAFSKRLKKPQASYFYLNRLIESLDHPSPVEGHKFQNGTYFFSQGDQEINLEQLVGMIVKNIKKYGSEQAGSDIKDAVFTVPAHWGFRARLALVNAAYLADLSILGLVNENSAAAIHFAITRNDSDPINVGFFNLGSQNLQVSILQFYGTLDEKNKSIETIRALAHVSIPNTGGLKVDEQLAEYIAEEFKAKHKLDVRQNHKAYVKLLHKAADLKETLSANKEANIYIEGLIDGIDLNTVVKREILEKSSIFPVINDALKQVLEKAGITKDQLHSVEIIGGASRIPLVTKIVKEFFQPVEVGSHINGDEAMAFGSALRAANLSIAFRVKQLHFYDGLPEITRVVVSTIEDGVILETELFDRNSQHGLKKSVSLEETDEDLKVSIFYGEELIHQYLVTNLSAWKNRYNQSLYNFTDKPNSILTFVSSTITIAELKEAYINISLNVSTTREVYEVVMENITIEQSNSTQNANTTENSESNNNTTEESNTGSNKSQTEEEVQSGQSQTNKTEKSKRKRRERPRTVKKLVEDFKIETKKFLIKADHSFAKYKKYSKDQIDNLKQIIYRYERHENEIRDKAKVRNDFQSTLYRLKEDFQNPALKTFSSETQLTNLKDIVQEELVWMDEYAWTATKFEIQKHYRNVNKVLQPIINRSNEYNQRERSYNQSVEILSLTYQKTTELNASQPWVSEKALEHLRKINQTVEWIHERLKKQIDRKPNLDIIFYNNEMINKAEKLRDQYYLIKLIPRPKVVKKPQETPKQTPKSDEEVDLDAGESDKPEDAEEKEQGKDEREPQDL